MEQGKCFPLLQIPVLSFFSKGLYRGVMQNWRGRSGGFVYLFLLLAVCWAPSMVKLHFQTLDFIRKDAPGVVTQLPEITIEKGVVSVKAPQPYYIHDPGTRTIIAAIDTTGGISSLEDSGA